MTFRKIYRARIRDCRIIENRRLEKNRKERERKAKIKLEKVRKKMIVHKVGVQGYAVCKKIKVLMARSRQSIGWAKVTCKKCCKKHHKKIH